MQSKSYPQRVMMGACLLLPMVVSVGQGVKGEHVTVGWLGGG
jgi:hypothetical protein